MGYDKSAVPGAILKVLETAFTVNQHVACLEAEDNNRRRLEKEELEGFDVTCSRQIRDNEMALQHLSHGPHWKRIRHCLMSCVGSRLAEEYGASGAVIDDELHDLKRTTRYSPVENVTTYKYLTTTQHTKGDEEPRTLSLKAPLLNYADYGAAWVSSGATGDVEELSAILTLGTYTCSSETCEAIASQNEDDEQSQRKIPKKIKIPFVLVRHLRERVIPGTDDKLKVMDFHGNANKYPKLRQDSVRYTRQKLGENEWDVISPKTIRAMFTLAPFPGWTDCVDGPLFMRVARLYTC